MWKPSLTSQTRKRPHTLKALYRFNQAKPDQVPGLSRGDI